MTSTPILFLIFNRPLLTSKVFERIKDVKPIRLYIAADGPRKSQIGEDILCQKTRDAVVKNITWDCEVVTLFQEVNMGCKIAVSTAIDWFFSQEEEGIILEDDIVPDRSFFDYCGQMLEIYRNDNRVMHIAGFNVNGLWKPSHSYHASYFGSIWGWATWRRAWCHYDLKIKAWGEEGVRDRILKTYFPEDMWMERAKLYDSLFSGEVNTWDYQWTFARLNVGGLSIIPSVNLINNIGFLPSATHGSKKPKWFPKKYRIRTPVIVKDELFVDVEYDRMHNLLAMGKQKKVNKVRRAKLKVNAFIEKFF